MIIYFVIFGLAVLLIFNVLNDKFCRIMEMKIADQKKFFRVINFMLVVLLVNGYVRVLNVMV
ncbi:hypothetical protein KFZ58_06775 [Virgibacillus sp. NKC19-16]|uniref:hypothetical protein n=1 Tax=Virgibacillus salidurans TaxID=2831673 RepID=UPI001F1E22B8|nr:hypothetical protein [Virgibacillus sp. NKC19-16]UJL47567.1 hypothetical protein KFZ58_06775 [Virgibacillus sp. NKC19-16]